jgi:hypothetical protein
MFDKPTENSGEFFIWRLDKSEKVRYNNLRLKDVANVAHLAERHLAKVEVASSSLVVRSNYEKPLRNFRGGFFRAWTH